MAGRVVSIADADEALDHFRTAIERIGIHALRHDGPWGCAAVGVGALAAEIAFGSGCECVKRLATATPRTERERMLIVRASKGDLATTGTGQYQTIAAIYSAAVNRRSTIDDVRMALKQ
jgi:hypothetical protein